MVQTSHGSLLIIIPSFNGEEVIERCLRAVDAPSDVVVVDNASADRTLWLVETTFPEVKIIRNDTNLGFSAAVRLGMTFFDPERHAHVVLLNQDAILQPGALREMADMAGHLPEESWSFISPVNVMADGREMEYYFRDNLEKRAGNFPDIHQDGFHYREVDFINAACWLINPAVYLKIGGLDTDFFLYGEDLDFCNRSRYRGYKMYIDYRAACIHLKTPGDYENDPQRMFLLKLGDLKAWFRDPGVPTSEKRMRKFKMLLAALRFFLSGNTAAAREKFRLLKKAVK